MKRSNEKGAALIFAMIFVLVLSIMAASLMFLSQSETWASLNYRLMTQSRYGAEAGLHAAANYLMNNYPQPGGPGDPITGYTTTTSPVVTANGNPVVLGVSMNGLSSNYPLSSVVTNFSSNTANSLSAGNNNVNYSVNAELLSMKPFRGCGGQQVNAQLWKLTSHGDMSGVRNSEVEVSALLESHVVPCYNYAGFATGTGCGAIQFNGGGTVNSYDSGALSNGSPTFQQYMGNLGSNGNLNTAPNTSVNGTFSSPDTGVGNCSAGNVDALSGNTTAVTGCQTSSPCPGAQTLVKLPQTVNYLVPVTDYPTCTGAGAGACDGTQATALNQTNPGDNLTANPSTGVGSYGDISASGNRNVTFNPTVVPGPPETCGPATYFVNSIGLSGNAQVSIAPCPVAAGGGYQPITINIVGANGVTPLNLVGNGIQNPTFDASLLQIYYAGTGTITIKGNGQTAAVICAPNANVTLTGNGTVYGSVIGKQITASGNPVNLHYDRQLQNKLKTLGNWTLDTFTWSKY